MAASDPLAKRPLLIGVVHLPPLPGAPGWSAAARPRRGGLPAWVTQAVRDAETLAGAGFPAVIVENYGDAPFFKDAVPAETVAAITRAACAVRAALPSRMAVGVNVLRNATAQAIAVAAAADLDFVRVNVLAGVVATDQGLIEGRAAEVLRLRARLAPRVRLFADVRVKHARPLAERPIAEEVADLVGRGGADGLIVSGTRTGEPVDPQRLEAVRAAAPGIPLLVGSGASAKTIAGLLRTADGAIVGTSIKRGGRTKSPVDARRARAFAQAAR